MLQSAKHKLDIGADVRWLYKEASSGTEIPASRNALALHLHQKPAVAALTIEFLS
jgi:hypothetical protein